MEKGGGDKQEAQSGSGHTIPRWWRLSEGGAREEEGKQHEMEEPVDVLLAFLVGWFVDLLVWVCDSSFVCVPLWVCACAWCLLGSGGAIK